MTKEKQNKNMKDVAQEKAAEAAATEQKKKWYEESGFGFDVSDIVYIATEHQYVGGRFAVVIGPSDKPNHCKAQLQNPKTGEPQRSQVVLNNEHLTRVATGGVGNEIFSEFAGQYMMEPSGVYKVVGGEEQPELAQAQ